MAIGRFPVEAGHILMFARAIGDSNPVYADVESVSAREVGGVIAPPTFVQSSAHFDPDYPLRPKFDEPWFGSGRDATGRPAGSATDDVAAGVLHAEQHYEYHRPLLAGAVLTATVSDGATWEKVGKRGGKLLFFEQITVYRDERGDPVVTARLVGVRTERQPER